MRTNSQIATLLAALSLAGGVAACGSVGSGAGNPGSELTPEEATTPAAGTPPKLAALREQGSELLAGGTDAYKARIEELRGTPIVVNKWASWCGPCRLEFPHFQKLGVERGNEIAFLGVLSNDSEDAATTFLEELPLPYPSYVDPDSEIAAEIGAPAAFPATAFYDSGGELVFTRQGVYPDEKTLAADIDQYAR